MADETEGIRRVMVSAINGSVESNDEQAERERLEKLHGHEVWDTDQLRELFEVTSFFAPFCMVTRKSDGVKGTIMFQHSPRFYFDFTEN